MPGRPPTRWVDLPGCFDLPALGEADQDRIHRSRLQPKDLTEVIAVAPARTLLGESDEYGGGLRRGTSCHGSNIYLDRVLRKTPSLSGA